MRITINRANVKSEAEGLREVSKVSQCYCCIPVPWHCSRSIPDCKDFIRNIAYFSKSR